LQDKYLGEPGKEALRESKHDGCVIMLYQDNNKWLTL